MKHKRKSFSGSIRYISASPHGDPEGIVLDDGAFVKAPPHSLIKRDAFVIGALVSGEGDLIADAPNPVYHHALIRCGDEVLADDSVDHEEREELKAKHEADLARRRDAKDFVATVQGKVVAVAVKPKGEIDRLVLEDGTSIHVPKHLEIEDVDLGSAVEIAGKLRVYERLTFMKADSVRRL